MSFLLMRDFRSMTVFNRVGKMKQSLSINRSTPRFAAIVALGTFLVLVWAAATTSASTFPGVNGRIVFTSDRDGDYEIYSMDSTGGDLRKLTDNSDADIEPRLSPDGKTVAFASARDGNYEIYTMNASDGSNQTRRTESVTNDRSPAWYPDGLHLAESRGFNDDREIYRIRVDTGYVDETRLTDDSGGTARSDEHPTVTPDGTKVLWARDIGDSGSSNQEIFSMNSLTGGSKANLTNDASADFNPPSVSPDGSRFAWSSTRSGSAEVLIADTADGGNLRVFTDDSDLPSLNGFGPSFSPDGTAVLFGTFDGGGGPSFWSAQLDGTGLVRRTGPGESVAGPFFTGADWGAHTRELLTVTRTGTGTGSVTANWTGGPTPNFEDDTFLTGTEVTLNAIPQTGSVFTGWDVGACTGMGACVLTMVGEKSATAVFEIPASMRITGKPRASTRSRTATFRFSTVAGSGVAEAFSCRIDSRPRQTCVSSKTYRNLKAGRHTFRVNSVLSGLSGPTLTYRWRIR